MSGPCGEISSSTCEAAGTAALAVYPELTPLPSPPPRLRPCSVTAAGGIVCNQMLKAIGFWIRDLEDERYPAPQELVGVLPEAQRRSLAHYLESGATFEQYRGYAWCRFVCGASTESGAWAPTVEVRAQTDTRLGSQDLTDGTWVWPEGLAHYVREHSIVLPAEFMEHAACGRPPTTPAPHEPVETEFWERWCAAHRSTDVLQRLQAARVLAVSEIEELRSQTALARQAEIAALVSSEGLSGTRCLWKGCGESALRDRHLCARHYLGEPPVTSTRPLFTGLVRCLRAMTVAQW